MEAYWILAALLAAICTATVVGFALKRRQPNSAVIENLNARIRAWWVIILVGGAALLAGPFAIVALFALISLVALREFLTQPPARATNRSLQFLCFCIALPAQYLAVGFGWQRAFVIGLPLVALFALLVGGAWLSGTRGVLARAAEPYAGLLICVYGLSHIPALHALRISGYEERASLLMVFVVLISQVSDIMQYIFGKLCGKRLLAPKLSPSKTVEGLIGGLLSASVLGGLLAGVTPFKPWQAAGMAFVIGVFGICGGLVLSAVKRRRGLKDWGQWIEGHGGMLDRVDSLTLSAPVFFHLTRWFFA